MRLARVGSVLFLFGVAPLSLAQAPLTISDTQVDHRQFTPANGEEVAVRFRLNRAAKVELRWFDVRDLLVRRIAPVGEIAAGEAALKWDGRDEAGRAVPPDAYHFTLVAAAVDGATQEHDLTDLTSAEDVAISNITLADGGRSVKYVLSAWSRANIRIGMREGGPLLGSLVNWHVRAPGENTEAWNGMDASGVMSLVQSTALELTGMSLPLSQNSVVVGDPKAGTAVIADMPWGEVKRVPKPAAPKRMYAHSQQSYEQRGDFVVELASPGKKSGIASAEAMTIKGVTPFSVKVGERDQRKVADQRFELVYFIDGLFIGENEIGFLPATWNVDAARLTPGEHYLTVNVRGYEGTFGVGSKKIRVQ